MSEYVFSDGTQYANGVSAQEAGEELQRIREERGRLTPATVVDESRPEDAVLHPVFEWRDPVAAEQWREHQAATLIKRVRVVPVDMEPVMPVSRGAVVMPPVEKLEEHDPLIWDLDQAVAALQKAKDQVQSLKAKAAKRFDRKRQIQAGVALADLNQADELLEDARESLTAGREASKWEEATV